MANTFKNAFAANVSNSSFVDLYTCPSATTTVILGLALCNKTASAVNATVQIQDTSDSNNDFQVMFYLWDIPQALHQENTHPHDFGHGHFSKKSVLVKNLIFG